MGRVTLTVPYIELINIHPLAYGIAVFIAAVPGYIVHPEAIAGYLFMYAFHHFARYGVYLYRYIHIIAGAVVLKHKLGAGGKRVRVVIYMA